ncbi:MAG: toxin-antitoxin system YwqK family antitoxin, partial [Bacteroidales bacterium]|nr:toxin-antitoxin system YwqK family antitoxin [Bacteroidales bacterium]
MKKIISLTFLFVCVASLQAQVRYQKFYDAEKKHPAVEGMMTDDSVRMGNWTFWHPNGQVFQMGQYNDRGEKTGLWKVFYEDGSRCAEENFENGVSKEWYSDGSKKSEVPVVAGRKNGMYRSWYPNGQKKEELTFANGKKQGAATEWHENGVLKFKGTYRDNEL